MLFQFHPEATSEFKNAVRYYRSIDNKLSHQFIKELKFTLQNIQQFPQAWTLVDITIRRCLLNRFPFAVIYHVAQDNIYILAVMNLNRKPNYWQDRL